MIKVTNLVKVYKNSNEELRALDNVSFTLPDKGLVFIVGKSGSGKSTLINMLGGLDDVTSGDIFVDNLNIAKLSNTQLDKYRNKYLGIIYQNYNLFENETVIDNIRVSSDISGLNVTSEQVTSILKDLDLEDIKNKLVKNLSGGQKQRVAIARALIKNPSLILADEPTGNLDTKTAVIIFDLLKKISEDRLVVVISHDMKSANDYADRILRISDGQIVEDLVRVQREKRGDENIILIDEDDVTSQTGIDEINKSIKDLGYKIKKKEKVFKVFDKDIPDNGNVIDLSKTKTSYRNVFKTGFKILKNSLFSLVMTILLSILMIGLLALSTSFIAFNGVSAVDDVVELYGVKSMVLRKGYSFNNSFANINKDHFIECDESDEALINNSSYTGNHYPIVNVGLLLSETLWPDDGMTNKDVSYNSFYPQVGLGVVVCDNNFLKHQFGDNYQVVAGSIYGLDESAKIIVTDYFADAFIYYHPDYMSTETSDPYQKVVNVKLEGRYTIGAVIKTDYREKYGVFLAGVAKAAKEPQNASEIFKSIAESPDFHKYCDDADSRLNFAYSLNPNFQEDYKDEVNHAYLGNSFWSEEEFPSNSKDLSLLHEQTTWIVQDKKLEGDNVIMNSVIYNKLFGKNCINKDSPEFEEKTIYIHNFGYDQSTDKRAKYVVKAVITDIADLGKDRIVFQASIEKRKEIARFNEVAYGYVFDDVHQAYSVFETMKPYFFYNTMKSFDAVFNTINIITIFSEVFRVLMFVLLGVLTLIIILHNLKTIKKEQYRLGVYKSLGYTNPYLTIAILMSNLIMIGAIFIFSIGFTYGMSFLVNYLLQAGFYHYTNNTIYFYITLLMFRFDYSVYFNLIALGLTIVSSFIPLLAIRRIKPNKIIKNAE